MSEQLIIRRMERRDLEIVSRIEAECFSQPWSVAAYESALKDEKCLYLVAELNGTIVGMCGLMNLLGEGDVSNVALTLSVRGRGIGQIMMGELIRRGKEMGITEFTLEVRDGNLSAVRLYEKMGFVTEGIRPGFYEQPKEDARIMWLRNG